MQALSWPNCGDICLVQGYVFSYDVEQIHVLFSQKQSQLKLKQFCHWSLTYSERV